MLLLRIGLLALVGLLVSAANGESLKVGTTKSNQTLSTTVSVSVNGKLITALPGNKAQELPLSVTATLKYDGRRLQGRGRDALAFRAFRKYHAAKATIKVSEQTSTSELSADRRELIAQGTRAGVESFSRKGPLSFAEAEVLSHPGDPLSLLGLLPSEEVDEGDDWTPADWAVQFFASVDALVKHDVKCTFKKLENGRAEIVFKGLIEGAHLGASVKMNVSGVIGYDVTTNVISAAAITLTDNRTVATVTPGLDITAKVSWTRKVADDEDRIADDAVAKIPLNPRPERLFLASVTPWGVRYVHSRDWHVFKQTPRVAVVRLIDNGNLVAQFNASPVTRAATGISSLDRFKTDIQAALGKRFEKFDSAKTLKITGSLQAHQVLVSGKANDIEMLWIYYLVAEPKGRQTAFVFAVEKKLAKTLGESHETIVRSLEFMPEPKRVGSKK